MRHYFTKQQWLNTPFLKTTAMRIVRIKRARIAVFPFMLSANNKKDKMHN